MGKKKEALQLATPRQMWRNNLSTWNMRRLEAAKLAKEIVDLRNETTYSTAEKVDTAIGMYIRPSNLFIDISERLYSALSQLESKQAEMTESVERMSAILSECEVRSGQKNEPINVSQPGSIEEDKEMKVSEGPDADMDIEFLQTLLGSITEQTLLEKNLCVSLRPPSDTSAMNLGINHDAAVTILACFSYAPSLDETSLNLALEM